jgi:hypothetical protein
MGEEESFGDARVRDESPWAIAMGVSKNNEQLKYEKNRNSWHYFRARWIYYFRATCILFDPWNHFCYNLNLLNSNEQQISVNL